MKITTDVIKQIGKEIKIQVSQEQLEKFVINIDGLVNLANEIQNIDSPEFSIDMLQNFSYQNLKLLSEPTESIIPSFYRENMENMIMVPKFVNKDE
jgi:Asp-tRNA(Asn)/Glu-tRNA(Gln) amidotransferase C subunit